MHDVKFIHGDAEQSSLLRSTANSKWRMSRKEERLESGRDDIKEEAEICNWITSGKMPGIGRQNLRIPSTVLLTYVTFLLSLCLSGKSYYYWLQGRNFGLESGGYQIFDLFPLLDC